MVLNLNEVTTLLSRRIGINPNTLGAHTILRAISRRQAAYQLTDRSVYLRYLKSSPQEFHQLVEQIVVPETWFFRDQKPFNFLVDFVRSEWSARPGKPPLRVLSAPCSTGEEPYSIAIALLEAGLSPDRVIIDALDISHAAIAKARLATYGKHSFRGGEWIDQNRYFQPVGDRYEVRSSIRKLVNFQQGNLLEIAPSTIPKYDIIFCRNLLIYLEPFACDRLFKTWHRLLNSQGLLFVGAAETSKVPSDRFLFLRQSSTFAYRKLNPSTPSHSDALINSSTPTCSTQITPPSHPSSSSLDPLFFKDHQPAKHPKQHPAIATNRRVNSQAALKQEKPNPTRPDQTQRAEINPSTDCDLKNARDLADAGLLARAIDSCNSYLEHHRDSVEAHTLLGTLYQALNHDEQAERCFQKALYLHPQHYEALIQLALLKEAHGDVIGVKRLQERIAKLSPPKISEKPNQTTFPAQ